MRIDILSGTNHYYCLSLNRALLQSPYGDSSLPEEAKKRGGSSGAAAFFVSFHVRRMPDISRAVRHISHLQSKYIVRGCAAHIA